MRDRFPHVSQILEGDFISVRIHVAPVFARVRIQEKTPGELFMYWFRARGYAGPGLPQGPFQRTMSTPLKMGLHWVLSLSQNGFEGGSNVGFDPS